MVACRRRGRCAAGRVAARVLVAVLLAAVPARAGILGPDRMPVTMVARKAVTKYPAVVVMVGVDSLRQPVSLGEGVVLDRRGDRCVILTAGGVLGKATWAFVRYSNDGIGEVRKVLRWEPAPGLALLEAEGPCPAVAERLPEEELSGAAGPVTVFGAPTWGLQSVPHRATLDPAATSSSERRRYGEAGEVRLEEPPRLSYVLAGAPVLDPGGRLVGILGRPRKGEVSFGFLPLPPRETLVAAANRSDKLIYYTRIQPRYHPLRKKRDRLLFGMAWYWLDQLELGTLHVWLATAHQEVESRNLVAVGDACLRLLDLDPELGPRAIRCYRRAAEEVPGDDRIVGLLGYALARDGRLEEAELAFRRALRLAPGEFAWLLDLGAVLIFQEKYSAAIDPLRQAIAAAPRDPAPRINLAIAYFEQGILDQALQLAEEAGELAPGDTDTATLVGAILLQQDRWQEARRILEKVDTQRRSLAHHLILTCALLLSGEVERGRKELRFLFDYDLLSPRLLPRFRVIGRLIDEGQVPRGIRLLHRLLAPGPISSETWRSLAEAAESLHEWPAAAEAWGAISDRDPADRRAKAHLGAALVFAKEYDAAAPVLEECLEAAPDSPRLLGFLALARIGQGRDDEARDLLARLEDLDPAVARRVRAAWENKKRFGRGPGPGAGGTGRRGKAR